MNRASALYFGQVTHRRLRPKPHQFAYRVFSMLLDLDELADLDRSSRLFSYNRAGLFSFHDRDHGFGDGDLRHLVNAQLAGAGIDIDGGPIRLLCYPRLFGYVFNPITVYFCHWSDGSLAAMIYQVDNTFGDRHSYVIPVAKDVGRAIHQQCDKVLHVSPFMSMDMIYRFRIAPPDASVAVAVEVLDAEGPILEALFVGRRVELTDRALALAFLRYPLMTFKVIAAIHWEAFRLWRKGLCFRRRPVAPTHQVTVVPVAGEAVDRRVHADA